MLNVILILIIHFISDFLCQSREMANKKSKSLYWLSIHVCTYSLVTSLLWVLFFVISKNLNIGVVMGQILIITFITHWVTDLITSKLTTYYYSKNNHFAFFGVIGFDQLIHTITLLLTYNMIFNV